MNAMTSNPKTTSAEDPGRFYENRLRTIGLKIAAIKRQDRFFIVLKLTLFFGGIFLFSRFFAHHRGLSFVFLSSAIVFFVAAVILHERVLRALRFQEALRLINKTEVRALAGEFADDAGEDLVDPAHPYSADLDIFGRRSLFHLLDRTVTDTGRAALAALLRAPLDARSIRSRQDAVRELAGKVDFRQQIRAQGLGDRAAGEKPVPLDPLFAETPSGNRGLRPFWLFAIPTATLASFVSAFFGLPWEVFSLFLLGQFLINAATGKKVSSVYSDASRRFQAVQAYAKIIRDIENEDFSSGELQGLKGALSVDGVPASKAVRKLAGLLEGLDSRAGGFFHFILNNTVLWDLHGIRRIERWKTKYAAFAPTWLAAAGAVDALSSLANLAFNNPGWVYPRIHEDGFRFRAMTLGHPLIPAGERVSNDFSMEAEGTIAIITGPNMAGKSTFLRTLGINAVLAFAGAPACAAALEISPFPLITSMKSSDSLDRHMSLFYAELERLKKILDALDGDPRTFFMIDEMLKGTNALDRHKGAAALVRQLLRRGATGIVATHDVELTRFEAEDPRARNYHFDGFIEDDRLMFDFKVKEGVCKSFNALLLMKKIGIDV
jgi:hypothetical protein